MRRRSFTMLELLITIGIIMILAGITAGGYSYATSKSDESKTLATMQEFEVALDKYKADKGTYPICQEAKEVIFVKNNAIQAEWKKFIQGKYFKNEMADSSLVDAYNRNFFYRCPGVKNTEKYDLWSRGADTKHGDGTNSVDDAGKGDDIANWKN